MKLLNLHEITSSFMQSKYIQYMYIQSPLIICFHRNMLFFLLTKMKCWIPHFKPGPQSNTLLYEHFSLLTPPLINPKFLVESFFKYLANFNVHQITVMMTFSIIQLYHFIHTAVSHVQNHFKCNLVLDSRCDLSYTTIYRNCNSIHRYH